MAMFDLEKASNKLLAVLSRPHSRFKFKHLKKLTRLSTEDLQVTLSHVREIQPNLTFAKFDRTYYLADRPSWYSARTDLSRKMPMEGEFGLVSDTHLGSIAERPEFLEEAYTEFARRGITKVFHCGDLTDGWKEYKGHINFVKVFGDQPQAAHAIKVYPRRPGITTYVIQGNHDDSYKHSKVDRLSLVTRGFYHEGRDIIGRSDIVYLGHYSHYMVFPQEVLVQLVHPKAKRQQRRSEGMDRNSRPDLQCSGHYHSLNYTWINHTHFIACPGMQDETELSSRLGYPRDVGYIVVRYKIKEGKFQYVCPQVFMQSL